MNLSTDFLDEARIHEAMRKASDPSHPEVRDILDKAVTEVGLTPDECAVLLMADDPEQEEQIFEAARRVKESIYGKRIVLFAPLYLSNYCVNNCTYCGFRVSNTELERRALDKEMIQQEVKILLDQGHKRLLLVFGEHPDYANIEYIRMAVKAVYDVNQGEGINIRRVNINAAPLSVEEFAEVNTYGIGTFQSFQETYHRETYKKVHPSGPKSDYDNRLLTMHRALEGGIDDIGMGVLYGLYDHRFETLATIMHSQELDRRYNIGPHTISVPRIEPALNAPDAVQPPAPVSDREFKRIVAAIRLTLPYTGMILSTRENAEFRDEVIRLGISQISAGSRTNPGGYKEAIEHDEYSEQFTIYDTRSLDEVMHSLCEMGLMPSMCTACYRIGRTGEKFMEEAKSGHIHTYCLPNAILTFREFLEDYASEETKRAGLRIIAEQMKEVDDPRILKSLLSKLEEIEQGKRDVFF
ncbi:MAG: [FeFe] hydrogenase H-cluster radical SAM maturase HydG [Planctomycetota bacterium]|nr:[FeFe] hydrogenase H-cluster radical SAM maturase HydG [Planctomycetota bacterium]